MTEYSVFFCFLFFKQKTAYEMRISDWSSDVCSSDLLHLTVGQAQQRILHAGRRLGHRAGRDNRRGRIAGLFLAENGGELLIAASGEPECQDQGGEQRDDRTNVV